MNFLQIPVLQVTIVVLMVLLEVGFFSLFERKLLGGTQIRKGPNKVSIVGILQPIADAVKLMTKSDLVPSKSSSVYYLPPLLFMVLGLMFWLSNSVTWVMFSFPTSLLMVMSLMAVSMYGPVVKGWVSNSKYASIGTTRSISQVVSYEICLTTTIFSVIVWSQSLSTQEISENQEVWNLVPLLALSVMALVSMFAETQRSPFDLAEGESELVSGYSVEYGGVSYTLIFLSENISIMFMSFLYSVLFSGGLKLSALFIIVLFVWVRSTTPRVRVDKVISLCWLSILPLCLGLAGLTILGV